MRRISLIARKKKYSFENMFILDVNKLVVLKIKLYSVK